MLDRVEQLLEQRPLAAGEVSQAFWHACSGGQRRAAEYLLAHGAELNWVPDYADGTPLDAASFRGTRQDNLINWLRERGAATKPPDWPDRSDAPASVGRASGSGVAESRGFL